MWQNFYRLKWKISFFVQSFFSRCKTKVNAKMRVTMEIRRKSTRTCTHAENTLFNWMNFSKNVKQKSFFRFFSIPRHWLSRLNRVFETGNPRSFPLISLDKASRRWDLLTSLHRRFWNFLSDRRVPPRFKGGYEALIPVVRKLQREYSFKYFRWLWLADVKWFCETRMSAKAVRFCRRTE